MWLIVSCSEITLSEREYKIIDLISRGIKDLDKVANELGLDKSALMRDLAGLESRGLVKIIREDVKYLEVTEEGRRYITLGLPEERILKVLLECSRVREGIELSELPKLCRERGIDVSSGEIKIGIQYLIRAGVCSIERGIIKLTSDERAVKRFLEDCSRLRAALKLAEEQGLRSKVVEVFGEDLVATLKRRKLVKERVRTYFTLELTEMCREYLNKGLLKVRPLVTRLTPELITSGKWKEVEFKKIDFSIPVPVVYPGRKHPYMEFLDYVRELLISMGFEEMKGPHVELEFWNFDILFQAQDHPAREVHDTYFLKYPREGIVRDEELMKRVAAVHENGWVTGSRGWGYKWDPRRALRLILRTQTTAVSMRTLYERGEGEYRCFALDRVFRPETLDPKHSMEFYQLEGIIVGKNISFKHLLGFFVEFCKKLGLGKPKFKPAYFPFTEPSVEGFIYHPKLGWIEVLPGGMFRPEVLLPLGIKNCRVAAWGIGIDRIAMTVLGIDDIRDLFSKDLTFLRRKPLPLIPNLLR